MATAITDGPGGLECRHIVNGVTLNNVSSSARYKLDRITGLHSLPEADDDRRPRTGMLGETIYPSYARGKTIVYEGRMQASTLNGLRAMGASLRSACQNRSSEVQVLIAPDAAWGSDDWGYYARVMQLDLDDEQTVGPNHARGPYQRAFTLGLRMSDPRFYWELASLGLQTSLVNGDGVGQTLTNSGNAPSDPVFTIETQDEDVLITNTSVGTSNGTARMKFTNVPYGTLVVNFASRTVTLEGEDGFRYYDNVYSQWWDELIPGFRPGTNAVAVTGCGNWQASWWHRSW